jgi:hypothetical protein
LNISSKDYVPVLYVDETSWFSELMRFAPTLGFIGLYLLFTRGQAGAGGGLGMLSLLLMPLAGLHFCVGLDFVKPSL